MNIFLKSSLLFFAFISFTPFPGCTMWRLGRSNANIGAIAESSSELAKVITSIVPAHGPAKRVLEVGAGTGVFTKKIIKKLGPKDHLDVIELTPELCQVLQDKFSGDERVTIYCGDILTWNTSKPYDYIVSGLPFNSFPADLIEKITDKYVTMARPGALCAFFEYKWLQTVKKIWLHDKEEEEYKKRRRVIKNFVRRYKIWQASAYCNLPPANVHLLQINK